MPKYTWPAKVRILATNGRGEVLLDTGDRNALVCEELLFWHNSRTVTLSISTGSKAWVEWNQANLEKVEEQLRFEAYLEEYYLRLKRQTTGRRPLPCTTPFCWQVHVRKRHEREPRLP